MNKANLKSALLIFIIYVACFTAVMPFSLIQGQSILLILLYMDLTLTLVIFLLSLLFQNSSFYDPFWSCVPWALTLFEMFNQHSWTATSIIYFAALSFWSWRLTINWFLTFRGLQDQDWRYEDLKAKNPKLYPLVSFFGIMLFPTALTYLGALPGFFLVAQRADFNPLIFLGFSFMILGTIFEIIADTALHRYLQDPAHAGQTCQRGIFRLSRHPNYLGEIMVWLGISLSIFVIPDLWPWFFCFVPIYLLFRFISIPMMEKHEIARRPDYQAYRQVTSALLLLPPKKGNH